MQHACDVGGRPGVTTLPVSCLPRWPWAVRSPTDTGVCVRVARTVKRVHLSFLKQKRAHLIWWLLLFLSAGCPFVSLHADLLAVPSSLCRPLWGTSKWFPVISHFRAACSEPWHLCTRTRTSVVIYSAYLLHACSGGGTVLGFGDTENKQRVASGDTDVLGGRGRK